MERCGGGRLRFLVLAAVASLGLAAASLGLGAFESPLSSAAKLDAALLPRSLSAREPERRKGGTGRDAALEACNGCDRGRPLSAMLPGSGLALAHESRCSLCAYGPMIRHNTNTHTYRYYACNLGVADVG